MKSKELQRFLHSMGDDLDVEIRVPRSDAVVTPIESGCYKKEDRIVLNARLICRGYTIHKDFIKGDTTENCPMLDGGVFKTREEAAVSIAINVYNEIGWSMPDIKGKFAEVLKEVEGTSPERKYSFANCLWWIEEVY